MDRLEIENIIDELLEKNPLTLTDCLKNTKIIKSVNDYRLVLENNLNFYQNQIEDYANELLVEATNFENNLDSLYKLNTKNEVENRAHSFFSNSNYFSYNRKKNFKYIFHDYLDETVVYKSFQAIKFIYDNFEKSGLDIYIQLLKGELTISSCFTSNELTKTVGFAYLGFRLQTIGFNSVSNEENFKDIILNMKNTYSLNTQTLNDEKNEFKNFLFELKEKENDWFQTSQNEYDSFKKNSSQEMTDFFKNAQERLKNIEQTYSEKLKVVAPAKHMEDEAKKYSKEVVKYGWIVAGIVALIIFLLYFIITPEINYGETTLIEITLFSKQVPIYSSIIILSIISILIYFLRVFIKLLMSSKHLEAVYKQKHALTYFYLSLINNGNLNNEEVNNQILTLLFTSADTGLIKGDSSPDLEKILLMLSGKN